MLISLEAVVVTALLAGPGKPAWTGESGGVHVAISESDIVAILSDRADAQTLFSLAARHRARLPELEKDALKLADEIAAGKDDPTDTVARVVETYQPLSLVGPYLSLRRWSGDDWPGQMHPSGQGDFEVIDLRTPGKAVTLAQLFPESALLAALLADDVVQGFVDGHPKTLAAFFQAAGRSDLACALGPGMLESFAFYDVVGGKVAVRIGMDDCAAGGMARGLITELGILLRIPPALRADLAGARDGSSGFLMKTARRSFAEVRFDWTKDLRPMIHAARRRLPRGHAPETNRRDQRQHPQLHPSEQTRSYTHRAELIPGPSAGQCGEAKRRR
jgi:hypothetical protein